MWHGQPVSRYDEPRNIPIWLALAFQGGAINVGGFLACHRFVTHTTGFATLFGRDLAFGNWLDAIGILSVPLFFLGGSMLSAFFVDRELNANRKPKTNYVLFLMFFFMVLVTIAGVHGSFGDFGHEVVLAQDYTLLALLCLTSGLQNATITSAYNAIVRTTHLTGITTDLGIGLVRVLFKSHKRISRSDEIKANWMRVGVILSFILGSGLSAMIFVQLKYWGFLFPALTSGLLWIVGLKRVRLEVAPRPTLEKHG